MPSSSIADIENRRIALFTLLGIVLGLIGAVVAFALYRLILLFTNIAFFQRWSFSVVYPSASHVGNWVLIIPAIGGLLVGLMAKYGSDRIRGHGIPEAMEAVLINNSRVLPKVAVLKPISAAIATGTGGPFGAEGPIIQTGGAIGSVIGQAFHMTSGERKILLGCGAAAGMVGIFFTPITAVVLVLELLLFEFRPRSLLPVIMAAAVAAGARHYLIGDNLMFPFNETYGSPSVLPLFAVLGLAVGVVAAGFSRALYFTEELFERLGKLHIDFMWWPAIGGLVLGVIARFEPRVLGMGYNTISSVIHGNLSNGDLLKLSVAKSVALWAALGSGTSGGLLAPMLLIGASVGNLFGAGVHALLPGADFNPHVAAIVAMSALFGAAARAPFTAFVFAFELTGDTSAIVPLMIGGVSADVVCRFLLKQSIMTERLARRGLHVPTEFEADPLRRINVGAAMTRSVDAVPAAMSIRALQARIDGRDPRFNHQGFPVVDEQERLFGVITRSDLAAVATSAEAAETADVRLDDPVSQICSTELATVTPDLSLADALLVMVRRGVGRLPVVDPQDQRKLAGWLSRRDVFTARAGVMQNELLRERWFAPPALWRRRAQRPLLPLNGAAAVGDGVAPASGPPAAAAEGAKEAVSAADGKGPAGSA